MRRHPIIFFDCQLFSSALDVKLFQSLWVDVVEHDLASPRRANSVAVGKQLEPVEHFALVSLHLKPYFVIAHTRNDTAGHGLIRSTRILEQILVSAVCLLLCSDDVGAQVGHVAGLHNDGQLVCLVAKKIKCSVHVFNAANAALRELVDWLCRR